MAWWNRNNGKASVATAPGIRHVPSFYSGLAELQNAFSDYTERLGDITADVQPLLYQFSKPGPRNLITSPDGDLWNPAIMAFMDHLLAWAGDNLGCMHISTPNLLVFLSSMGRSQSGDQVKARWHYMFCLSLNAGGAAARVGVTRTAPEAGTEPIIDLELVDRFHMGCNDLLVHETRSEYDIAPVKTSMNPAEAFVILDGYLW